MSQVNTTPLFQWAGVVAPAPPISMLISMLHTCEIISWGSLVCRARPRFGNTEQCFSTLELGGAGATTPAHWNKGVVLTCDISSVNSRVRDRVSSWESTCPRQICDTHSFKGAPRLSWTALPRHRFAATLLLDIYLTNTWQSTWQILDKLLDKWFYEVKR